MVYVFSIEMCYCKVLLFLIIFVEDLFNINVVRISIVILIGFDHEVEYVQLVIAHHFLLVGEVLLDEKIVLGILFISSERIVSTFNSFYCLVLFEEDGTNLRLI